MTEKRSRGQPTKYKPEYEELVFWMAKVGLTDKQIAHEMGVGERSLTSGAESIYMASDTRPTKTTESHQEEVCCLIYSKR